MGSGQVTISSKSDKSLPGITSSNPQSVITYRDQSPCEACRPFFVPDVSFDRMVLTMGRKRNAGFFKRELSIYQLILLPQNQEL